MSKMSRHYRHRVDANQSGILRSLNQIPGVQAIDIHNGKLTDVIVGHRGRNLLFEIKNPAQSESDRRLTPAEQKLHDSWPGQIAVVETLDEILAVMKIT